MNGRLTFAPSPSVLRQLRADVRDAVADLGAPSPVGDTVALVVDELVNNAIEHGAVYRRRGLDLAVQITLAGGRISVEFFDQEMPNTIVRELATALTEAANGMPSLENERGRGLFLLSVYLQNVQAGPAAEGGLCLAGRIALH